MCIRDSPNEFYAATASGNLWKTENNMTTWTPLFENEGAYAIGVIEMAKGWPRTGGERGPEIAAAAAKQTIDQLARR